MADSTIKTIGEALVARLAPISALGINVAVLANTRSQQSIPWDQVTYPNGTITIVWYEHDFQGVETIDRTGQKANAKWLMKGKLRNLKDDTGAWVLSQTIAQLTIGFRPIGGSGPIRADKMTLIPPKDELWTIEYEFITPITFQGSGNDDIGGVGANLEGIFFDADMVSDQWGLNTGSADFPSPPSS